MSQHVFIYEQLGCEIHRNTDIIRILLGVETNQSYEILSSIPFGFDPKQTREQTLANALSSWEKMKVLYKIEYPIGFFVNIRQNVAKYLDLLRFLAIEMSQRISSNCIFIGCMHSGSFILSSLQDPSLNLRYQVKSVRQFIEQSESPFTINDYTVWKDLVINEPDPDTGAFSYIYQCSSSESDNFAIKFFEEHDSLYKQFAREVTILTNNSGKATLKLIDANYIFPQFIIIPYYQNRSLYEYCKYNGSLSNLQKQIIMYGIAEGLLELKTRNIIHRDLKPKNILLTDDLYPMIADFNLSRSINAPLGLDSEQETANFDTSSQMTMEIGNIYYKATQALIHPESKDSFTVQYDVFSYGMLLIAILENGVHPKYPQGYVRQAVTRIEELQRAGSAPQTLRFEHLKRGDYVLKSAFQLNELRLAEITPVIPDCPPPLKALIENCLKAKPTDRPLIEDIVRMWIRGDVGFELNPQEADLFQSYVSYFGHSEAFLSQ